MTCATRASAYNLHFDGTAWTRVVNKTGRQRAWWGVSAVSKRDVWAVGPQGSGAHYDGTAWTEQQQQLAGIEYDLLHVLAFANQEVWVTAGPAGLVRFDGKQWTPVTAPALQSEH